MRGMHPGADALVVQGHVVVFLVEPLVCFGEVVGPEVPAHFLGEVERVDVPRLVGDYLSFFVAAGYHRAPLPATACFVGHQTIVPLNS